MASLISNEALGEDDKETTNANSSATGEEAKVQEFDPLFQWMSPRRQIKIFTQETEKNILYAASSFFLVKLNFL